jgi:uracil-DNA glycosylase family 4
VTALAPTADHSDRLARLVRQHAQTAALMGVDFVPSYRVTAAAASPPPGESTGGGPDAGAPTPPTQPAPAGPAPPSRPGCDREASQRRLDELRERYEREAPHKHFVTAHTRIVFGEGDPCARLMFIGEAPGADEDRTGRPFVGRAGQLLDKMIVAMGLRREDVYIANVLKTRPPNNATPTTEEAARCAPYLFEQIAIIRPEVIVALGLPASRVLLGSDESMGRLRGRWARCGGPLGGEDVAVMPTYHPAFLLRSYTPDNRAKVWSDLQQVIRRLGLPDRGGPVGGSAPAGDA